MPVHSSITRNRYKITAREFLLWLFRKRKRYQVSGHSMEPVFKAGDFVLVEHISNCTIQKWNVVLVQHPLQVDRVLVKYVHAIHDNQVEVRGLNADHSNDSRAFGVLPVTSILGQVTAIVE